METITVVEKQYLVPLAFTKNGLLVVDERKAMYSQALRFDSQALEDGLGELDQYSNSDS